MATLAHMVAATVRLWLDDEGWGVVGSSESAGGCLAHFSVITVPGCTVASAVAGSLEFAHWREKH